MLSKIKVVLDEGAKMPTKAHDTDAGFDLYAPKDFFVPRAEAYSGYGVEIGAIAIDTGVHIELPEGTVGMVKSKSGLNFKNGLTTEGVVDVGYTGSINVKMYNHTNNKYFFKKGDKIAQLVILPILQEIELVKTDSLSPSERGCGGFGSTGR